MAAGRGKLTTVDTRPGSWSASPYLHLTEDGIYNPHTGQTLPTDDPRHSRLRRIVRERVTLAELDSDQSELAAGGWLVEAGADLDRRYRLRYVSLETHTVCTQACSFCPVSIAPRKPEYMPTGLFERLVAEISTHGDALEGVTLNNYNEPTADRRFVDQVRTLLDHELPVAVLSNGSTFTPDKIDALVEMGPITYLSVNISGLDRERYKAERQRDHLPAVLEHLEYMKDLPVAETMDLVVLGHQDERHRADTAALAERFAGSRFKVRDFAIMDRAGYLSFGLKPEKPHRALRGCDNLGSRPIEHLHINPAGQCILCCEDYDEYHVIGDLTRQSLHEVMTGDEIARLRRMIYGLEGAPEDFICRKCVFALGGD
jgi:MoaA/NifB/PqqE/SkfB family radical SAM enzyme